MLKFPRSINEIDPLPDLCETRYITTSGQPLSEREINNMKAGYDLDLGRDWKQIRPHWFRNGKGHLRYAPPLPLKKEKVITPDPTVFYPGAKVVCVNAKQSAGDLTEGEEYTITECYPVEGKPGVVLEENRRKWYSSRFRLAENQKRIPKVGDRIRLPKWGVAYHVEE